jgi:hypothetical protein
MNHIQHRYRKGLLLSLCFYLFLGGCYSPVVDLGKTAPLRDTSTQVDYPAVTRQSGSMKQVSSPSQDTYRNQVIRFTNKDKLYSASYALLIGVSDYTAGWADLGSVPKELEQVKAVLKEQGFEVFLHLNPNSRQLKKLFEDFVAQYGYIPGNRLLFFFSGHGHTRKDGNKGYIVPADAPKPEQDEFGFLTKAVSMTDILAWARKIEAKHALFLFDSCFSGTVFKSRNLPIPSQIKNAIALPVRQFITAGRAGDTVPAKSIFTPAFVDALKYGWGDINKDGYILGTELGFYLNQKVPESLARQIPQYGKIPDYDLSRGDFVFFLKDNDPTPPPEPDNDPTPPPEPPVVSTKKRTISLSLHEVNKGRHFSIQPLAQLYEKHGFEIMEPRSEAEYVLEGKLTVTSGPPIRGTSLRPRYIDLDITIRSRSDNSIVKRINVQTVSPHIDEFQGAKVAFITAVQKVEAELFSLP